MKGQLVLETVPLFVGIAALHAGAPLSKDLTSSLSGNMPTDRLLAVNMIPPVWLQTEMRKVSIRLQSSSRSLLSPTADQNSVWRLSITHHPRNRLLPWENNRSFSWVPFLLLAVLVVFDHHHCVLENKRIHCRKDSAFRVSFKASSRALFCTHRFV